MTPLLGALTPPLAQQVASGTLLLVPAGGGGGPQAYEKDETQKGQLGQHCPRNMAGLEIWFLGGGDAAPGDIGQCLATLLAATT